MQTVTAWRGVLLKKKQIQNQQGSKGLGFLTTLQTKQNLSKNKNYLLLKLLVEHKTYPKT